MHCVCTVTDGIIPSLPAKLNTKLCNRHGVVVMINCCSIKAAPKLLGRLWRSGPQTLLFFSAETSTVSRRENYLKIIVQFNANYKSIFKGIEDAESIKWRKLGKSLVQGYFFAIMFVFLLRLKIKI